MTDINTLNLTESQQYMLRLTEDQKFKITEQFKDVIRDPKNRLSIDQVKQLIQDLKPIDKRAKTSPKNGTKGGRKPINYTEIADKFKEQNLVNGQFSYKKHRGQWYFYNGKSYIHISTDDLNANVMAYLRKQEKDPQEKQKIKASISTRNNVIEVLNSTGIGAMPSSWNMPCWIGGADASGWLVMENCIVNVESMAKQLNGDILPGGEIARDHTPKLFAKFATGYEYDKDAQCSRWIEYLNGVQPEPHDQEMLQMLMGLSLITDTSYEIFAVLNGEGGTGKTVFLHVLESIVGKNNVCCLPLLKFTEKHSTHLLTTHLLNIVGDLPTSDGKTSLSHIEGILKDVASGGIMPVELKGQNPTQAPAIARNIFATNSLPQFSDRSGAIWERLRIICFDQHFRGTSKQNPNLKYEIVEKELPGVFNWAVEGLAKLRKLRQFPYSKKGLEIAREHRENCDHEREFLTSFYEISNGSYVKASIIYNDYRNFCQENGYRSKSAANFKMEIKRVFSTTFRNKERVAEGNTWVYKNIKKTF